MFHELGHFFFAKIFGVKAEIFSVGFGPRIISKQWGETEFRLSAIPLGGYVKLLGEDSQSELPEAEKKRSLNYQPPWKRFLIYFGGPFFNFILAILVFMIILAVGEEQIASVVGRVVPGSYAEIHGFKPGDKILEVNGKPVTRFVDVAMEIHDHPGEAMNFEIQRKGQSKRESLQVKTASEDGYSLYGEEKLVGKIDGLLPFGRTAQVGVSNPKSLAGQLGIATGDVVTDFAAQKVNSWEEVEELYSNHPRGSAIGFSIQSKDGARHDYVLTKSLQASGDIGADWGLLSSEMFVEQVVDGSPAQKAGIQKGDRIVKLDDRPLRSFYELKESIQVSAQADGKVDVSWERSGEVLSKTIEPTATRDKDPLLKTITTFTIGIMPKIEFTNPDVVIEKIWNPFQLVWTATYRMLDFTAKNLVAITKMIRGDVSLATLGGPIMIGKLAGDSIERGLNSFLNTLAILSVGLGILNLLPIPVLDGGHLLLLTIEAIRRRPLTVRQMEVVQQIGLSIILLIMVIVIRNDLSRLPIFN